MFIDGKFDFGGKRIELKFTDDDAFLFVVVDIIGEFRSGDG